MATLRTLALALVAGAVAACQPAAELDYSDRYRPSQLDRAAQAGILGAAPETSAQARARDRAIYDAASASLSAQQSARRSGQLARQSQRLDRAQRNLVWAERDLARQRRELRTAEWLDRRPVGTDPFDRADTLRRMEQAETSRALDRARYAEQAAARAADRLDRLGGAASDLGRLQTMERIERREAERARAAARGEPDPLQRYLPYRRAGESVETLRARVEAAEARSAETGEPVTAILRAQRE